jgi:alpha-amylase
MQMSYFPGQREVGAAGHLGPGHATASNEAPRAHHREINMKKHLVLLSAVIAILSGPALAGEQPVAIFHAFDQNFSDIERFVCVLADQGYSHVQIPPAQKSNPDGRWWARYQPIDYTVIEGRGSEADLKRLIKKAHGCKIKVIADVVFNHMANLDAYKDLNFPGLGPVDFHPKCDINYSDGNRTSETECWLGGLPDLDQTKQAVEAVHKKHLKKLLALGIDGFRFDAAKHMTAAALQKYVDTINAESRNKAWNYLEVIEDADTRGEDYNAVAAVTDFVLYNSLKAAFTMNGDLKTLRMAVAINDDRSVTFGRNHDNIREINASAINPYSDPTDSYLATAFVLARDSGTPIVLNWDNVDSPFIKHGVKFRQIMGQRKQAGANTKQNVLAVFNSPTLLVMERGSEGFFVVNKAATKFDQKDLDLTLTNLEGCYRELRNDFFVAIERRNDNKKWVTRWGAWTRGGLEVQARDALFFIREPWDKCQAK